MPDWKKLVREQIASSAPPAPSQEEVVSELAAHLEETYENALSQGLTEEAAVEIALQEVHDWDVLAAKIRVARFEEDPMNDRTRSLWLPALANVIAAPGLLMIFRNSRYNPAFCGSETWPWSSICPGSLRFPFSARSELSWRDAPMLVS